MAFQQVKFYQTGTLTVGNRLLDDAMRDVSDQVAAGYTTFCMKPSQHTDDIDEVEDLCRRMVEHLARPVAVAHRGAEEAERHRLAHHEADLGSPRDVEELFAKADPDAVIKKLWLDHVPL